MVTNHVPGVSMLVTVLQDRRKGKKVVINRIFKKR